ncbi:hypothetical protein BUALT_Bualt04G0092600 [Buddleja alternifolia]|uniref:PB1 domain-containing protein n=1 Tax=Buddleja alternifolia TaxID=168488 RepID=A0AAV6XPK1_9LAMI|nr:hypothetical protein BUALT_Bualt04G0092600 [Buddleja alternifolia]
MEKQNSNLKVKLLCSYGGKIHPRPSDHHLSYVGGDTKILAVDRNVKFSEIVAKLNTICNNNKSDNFEVSIKYQLPGEDLDALVSLIDDDDVEHMMVEYDRMQRISAKPARLRLFIFDISGPPITPLKSGVKETGTGNPDYLFGFDKEYQPSIGPPLDLLQIPGMVLPENYGTAAAAGQAVYRVPVVANGGVCQSGQYAYGNREQPVYNFIPVMPPVQEQRMMEVKVNQRNF